MVLSADGNTDRRVTRTYRKVPRRMGSNRRVNDCYSAQPRSYVNESCPDKAEISLGTIR